jgi:hypothetical protein
MASNQLPATNEPLFTLGEDMADGLHAHELAIGIRQNLEADFRSDLTGAIAAQNDHKAAQSSKTGLSVAVTVADSNAKAFIGSTRRVLITFLGDGYSQAWDATGFPNESTAVPLTQAERQALLQSLQAYFSAHPEHEVNTPALVVTAARAGVLFTALSDARSAANDGNNLAGQKKNLRDAAVKKLRNRMSGLVNELGQLLEDEDPRWLAFGLNLPGATNLPEVADSLVLTAGGAGVVLADWSDASRATRYRVFKQVVGVDATFIAAATVTDSDYTFTGLTSGQTLRVQIIAANDAGQAQPSTPAEIVIP